MPRKTKRTRKAHFCPTCNKCIIGSYFNFQCHQFGHKEVKPRHTCGYCFRGFFRTDTFSNHLKKHSDKTYNETIYKKSLQNNRKIYPCKICCKNYYERYLLFRHIRQIHFNYDFKEQLHVKKLLNETWTEKCFNTDTRVEMTKLSNNVILIKRCKMKNENKEKQNKNIHKNSEDDKVSKRDTSESNVSKNNETKEDKSMEFIDEC